MTDRFPSFVNGRLVPFGEPAIRTDDTGFQLGLSVFDTVLWEDGAFAFLEDHLARLERGAAELDIPWPPTSDPREALSTLLRAIDADFPIALRMTFSRGPEGDAPTFAITARRVVRPEDPGVVVTLAREPRRAGDPLGRVKSTNRIAYVHAREEAQAEGAFEALLVTDEGDLLEGTISNVFCVSDRVLRTPAVERGCLPGTSRGRVLANLEREPLVLAEGGLSVEVGRIDASELGRASEVFLTNTTAGLIPVVEVRGVRVGLPGAAGPVVIALRKRFQDERTRDRSRG